MRKRFELRGQFTGFFRDLLGKRRMVLQLPGEELYLKVPKELRRELDGRLIPGQQVIVRGEEGDEEARDPRVVSEVRAAEAGTPCETCTIRVCAKKNCWRNGGKDFWQELEAQIEREGLGDRVKLKAVGCMDHCKRGPNAQMGDQQFHRCTTGLAEELVGSLTHAESTHAR